MNQNIDIPKEKDLEKVQFNLVNTTSSAISFDFFNLANLSNIPTAPSTSVPSYSILNNLLVSPFSTSRQALNTSNNTIYCLQVSTNIIDVYDISTNSVLTSIILPTSNSFAIAYCPINNSMYVTDYNNGSPIIVIDCTTNLVSTTIAVGINEQLSFIQYNPNTNFMFIGANDIVLVDSLIYFLDCTLNALTPSPLLGTFSFYINFSNVTTGNFIYFGLGFNVRKIDCSFLTILPVVIPIGITIENNLIFNSSNNYLYVPPNGGSSLVVIDTITDTTFTTILTPNNFGASAKICQLNTTTNKLFVATTSIGSYDVFDTSTNTYEQTNIISLSTNVLFDLLIDNSTEILFVYDFNGNIYQISTSLSVTPFYVSGSVNYNFFIQNLEYEPIVLFYIRFIASSQNQLLNNLQVTKIDSNGNQIFMPNLINNQVSSWQEQGNIALLKTGELVLDGRTYLNQYVLNANSSISFELFYKQLDRDSIKNVIEKLSFQKERLKDLFDDAVEL